MKNLGVIILILFSIHFWGYVSINPSYYRFTNVIALGIMGMSILQTAGADRLRFRGAIILFLVGIIANIFSAYFNNGQDIRDTSLTFFNYYFIIFYFYLHDYKVNKKDLENIIVVFAILYCIFYLRQEDVFPRRLFYGSMFSDRGTIRIRMEGNGFLMLAYFMMLNRYLLNRKLIHILLALFFFYVLLKGGFRTLTAGGILLSGITFLLMLKYSVTNYLLVILAVLLFLGLLQMESTSTIITNMITTTEEQQEEGEEYIRNLQYEYFTKVYPKNFSYYIVGGGLPGAYGTYARYMGSLIHLYGFYWVDLGLIGFYFVVGLIALLGILNYTLKGIFMKLPANSLYLNIYLAYLLIVSITTMEIFRDGIFTVTAITLYLIDISRDELMESKSRK